MVLCHPSLSIEFVRKQAFDLPQPLQRRGVRQPRSHSEQLFTDIYLVLCLVPILGGVRGGRISNIYYCSGLLVCKSLFQIPIYCFTHPFMLINKLVFMLSLPGDNIVLFI